MRDAVIMGDVCGDLNDEADKRCHEKEHASNTSDLRNHLGQVIPLELQVRVPQITM
jgi:hypothetical protein